MPYPESMTCKTCGTKTLILVRSIENTFWCDVCKKWRPCPRRVGDPPEVQS